MASRSFGGVSMTEMSRMPTSDMCSVRGMGVADIDSTSIAFLICFSFSFCADAEALLFVDDQQADVLELDVLRRGRGACR